MSKISKSIKQKLFPRPENRRETYDPSYLPQVVDKVRSSASSDLDMTEQLIRELARRICSPEELTKYFDLGSLNTRPIHDTLPVQLVLKYYHQADTNLGPIESLLREEYGPLHAYVVISDQILEWNWESIVIPHGKPIADGSGIGEERGVVSNLAPISVNELTEVMILVADWNRRFCYEAVKRNSQDFVRAVLGIMNRPSPPQLETKIKSYYDKLEDLKGESIPGSGHFKQHEGLDQFLVDHLDKIDRGKDDAEYLFVRYFTLHIKNQMMSKSPISWKCQEPNCKMKLLEGMINQEKMILKEFRTVRYTFYDSTSL